jgi:hypothetical protein
VYEDVTLFAKWTEDEKCEFNSAIYYDDENCVLPCEWNTEILANDAKCVEPETPEITPPVIPGAPNTGVKFVL